jgi:hypothetical protein
MTAVLDRGRLPVNNYKRIHLKALKNGNLYYPEPRTEMRVLPENKHKHAAMLLHMKWGNTAHFNIRKLIGQGRRELNHTFLGGMLGTYINPSGCIALGHSYGSRGRVVYAAAEYRLDRRYLTFSPSSGWAKPGPLLHGPTVKQLNYAEE